MPRRLCRGWPPLPDPHAVRACWRRDLFPWFSCQPHAPQPERRNSRLRYRDSYGWLRSRALRFQSLDELPLSRRPRQSCARRRAGRKARSAARLHRENHCRTLERCAPTQRKGIESHEHSALPLTEVSAKMRVGPPEDDETDYVLPVWAGVIPLALTPGAPLRDEKCDAAIPTPAYAAQYKR